MTLEDTILALLPVFFGWLLGVGTTGIPRFYKWIKAVRIKHKYSTLIIQIMESGLTDVSISILLPSSENGAREYNSDMLWEKDRKFLEQLEECVLFNKDWETFKRIVEFLDNKFHWDYVGRV